MENSHQPFPHQAIQYTLSAFSGYLHNLELQGLTQDYLGSAGSKLAHEGFISLFDFSNILTRPIYYSLKFSFSWLGKKIVCAFSPPMQKVDFDSANIELPICSMTEDGFVLMDSEPEKTNREVVIDLVYQITDGCKNYVLTVKPIDIANMTGGAIGASVAGLSVALFIGPPGLVGMPVLLLTEVMAKGFGEYLAGISARNILGNRSDLPIIAQTLQHVPDSLLSGKVYSEEEKLALKHTKLLLKKINQEQAVERLITDFEVLDIKSAIYTPVCIYGAKFSDGIKPGLEQYVQDDYFPQSNNLSPNKS